MGGTVRTDAERYRFLRDHCVTFSAHAEDGARFALWFQGDGLDLAAGIDAAMEPEIPVETAAPVAAVGPAVPRNLMAEAKTREARRIILLELRQAGDGRASVIVLADVLESYGLFFMQPERMAIVFGLERDGLIQLIRTPFRPTVLLLTEKGDRFRDKRDRFK